MCSYDDDDDQLLPENISDEELVTTTFVPFWLVADGGTE
jgi:hypothetical protein